MHAGWCAAGEDAYTVAGYCVERGGFLGVDDARSTDVCACRWRFMLCAFQKCIRSQVNDTLRCNLLHNGPVCLLSFFPRSQGEPLSFMLTGACNNLNVYHSSEVFDAEA